MIELRGRGLLGDTVFGRTYFQDHLPVREAVRATGHAVRQLYLAAGITDVYLQHGDASLLEAMERLWHDLFTTKTYITGGHGSRHRGESFGDPYELPPDRAYTETCAAIASFQWNWRMLLATGKGRYADEMERALYNGIAVGVAEDGRSFFYSNPLHLRRGHDGSTEDAPSERLNWYACACCPPNLARLAASFPHYVATQDQKGIQLHLFAPGRISASGAFGDVDLEVETDYPWNGRVIVRTVASSGAWTLALRWPAWCESATLQIDGSVHVARPDESGYLRLNGSLTDGATVTLDLEMPTRLVRAHPYVDAVRGCGALTRGPLVYCVEDGDIGESTSIDDIALDPERIPTPVSDGASAAAAVVLEGVVQVVGAPAEQSLYLPHVVNQAAEDHKEVTVRAIPYFRWANRGPRAMRVWLPLVQS
jgi:DUF1680 family protein